MSTSLDSDATTVLIVSIVATLLNIIFIVTIFVYFCCCIEVNNFKLKDLKYRQVKSRTIVRKNIPELKSVEKAKCSADMYVPSLGEIL
jgi:hypothetical protein